MKIIDRYIAVTVIRSILMIGLMLLSFSLIVVFLAELRGAKEGYSVWQAAWVIILRTPNLAYQVFPFAALIGTLLSIGNLGTAHELVALRAAGVSRLRLSISVLLGASVLVIPIMLVGEYVVPDSEKASRTYRFDKRDGRVHLGGKGGLWIRDGNEIINVRSPVVGSQQSIRFSNVQIFSLDDSFRPQSITVAREAIPSIDGQGDVASWELQRASVFTASDARVRKRRYGELPWYSGVAPGLLASAVTKPQFMSMRSLKEYISYLEDNGQDARQYIVSYWDKAYFPLTIFALLLATLPFVFVLARQHSLGVRVFSGIVLGSSYLIVARWVRNIAEASGLPFWLVALLPIIALASFGVYRLRRAV